MALFYPHDWVCNNPRTGNPGSSKQKNPWNDSSVFRTCFGDVFERNKLCLADESASDLQGIACNGEVLSNKNQVQDVRLTTGQVADHIGTSAVVFHVFWPWIFHSSRRIFVDCFATSLITTSFSLQYQTKTFRVS